MIILSFDTLAYCKELIRLGMPREQAEVFTRLARLQEETFHNSLRALKAEIKAELLAELRTDPKARAAHAPRCLCTSATRGDTPCVCPEIGELPCRIRKVRMETENLRLQTETIRANLLKWEIGAGVGIVLLVGADLVLLFCSLLKKLGWM